MRLPPLVLLLLPFVVVSSIFAQPEPPAIPHDRLMAWQDDGGRIHPVRTVEDWGKRRASILAGMQAAMGSLPKRDSSAPLDIQRTDIVTAAGFQCETISFASDDGDRITADLYLPAPLPADTKLPAMLALHPTGAQGKRIVAGEGPRSNRQYAVELARRGYVVIAPDYPSFGDLSQYDFNADRYVSGTMKGIVNHMRCVDLLAKHPAVDPARIGVIGHSLGGHNAMFVAAFDPRLKVIVSSCGWTPFHDYYGGKIAGWTSDRYMPKLRDEYQLNPDLVPFDFYEVVAALAPRPFFSNSPISDSNFDVNGVKKAIPKAKEVYELFGAGDQLRVEYPPCEHDFPTEIRAEAYAFIDTALHHQPTGGVDYSGELPRIAPLSPQEALRHFDLAEGFTIQQTAAEPLVTDPVAMCFDADGQLYVVEMKDYSEQETEQLGQIRLLRDTNQDGTFDSSTVFASGLSWPTAITCYDGGVFVGAPPYIDYFKDTDGDFVADESRRVFEGFGRSNVQGLLNSFHWGLDNRIYGATSSSGGKVTCPSHPEAVPVELRGRDFSFDPRLLDIRPESGGAQHGMCFDNWGRKFVCSNSDHAQFVMFDDRYLARNPALPAPSSRMSIADDGGQAPVYRTSPVEPWRIVRTRLRVSGTVKGVVEGGGRAAGYFTGATGITLYRGDAFAPDALNWAIIGDVGSNIVHRKQLISRGVAYTATRIDRDSELLRSDDNWFRPVQFANAPDGCLHVLDMYRETIEHPKSLPPEIKQHLDLTSGRDRGRLYRIVPEQFQYRPSPTLSKAPTSELVVLLAHPNAWHRETASRLLFERQDSAAVPLLRDLLQSSTSPFGRLHALYALAGLKQLTEADVCIALSDDQSEVRERALILAEQLSTFPTIQTAVSALVEDENPRVLYQLAFTLGEFPANWRIPLLTRLLKTNGEDRWIRLAALSSLDTGAMDVGTALLADAKFLTSPQAAPVLTELSQLVARQADSSGISNLMQALEALPSEQRGLQRQIISSLLSANSKLQNQLTQGESGALLRAMLIEARKTLPEAEHPLRARMEALQTLLLIRDDSDIGLLLDRLDSREPQALQTAALQALGRYTDPQIAERILDQWNLLTPESRRDAEELLFSRTPWIQATLERIASGERRTSDFTSARLSALRSYTDKQVQAQATKLLSSVPKSSRQAVVAQYQPSLQLAGDIERGRALFRKECSICHKLEGTGHEIGPNLATIQNRGAEAILTNVLDPNREVNPQYLSYAVALNDGRTQTGMIVAESDTSLTLVQAENKQATYLRADIDAIRSSGLSLMPEGLEKQISPEAMADLIAYLLSLR